MYLKPLNPKEVGGVRLSTTISVTSSFAMLNTDWSVCLGAPQPIDKESLATALSKSLSMCYPNLEDSEQFKKLKTQDGRIQITSLLADVVQTQCGEWSKYWQCSTADGGLGEVWCCPGHSAFRDKDKSPKATIDRVVDSVAKWADRIHAFRELFDTLASESEAQPLSVRTERAASVLVDEVVRINLASDAWYGTFMMVLCWYLQSIGVETALIEEQIEAVVEGNFESWCEPTEQTVRTVATQLATAVDNSDVSGRTSPVDTTALWTMYRGYQGQPLLKFKTDRKCETDRHTEFVRNFDFGKSEDRGEAMLAALKRSREDAVMKRELDWETLCEWQAIVLGEPVSFRESDAFAKEGRDWYPLKPATPKQFRKYLAEVNLKHSCPIRTAANAYRDICFFHPFPDGNARSARLAMEYVLTRWRLALMQVEPIFVLPRHPFDNRFEQTLRAVVAKRDFDLPKSRSRRK